MITHKIALFTIALSPFVLHAELQEAFDDDGDVSYTDSVDQDDEDEEDAPYNGGDDEEEDLADASYEEEPDSYESVQDTAGCNSPFHVMHAGVRHTEARGVGYGDGYTTIEGFGIYDHNPYFMPFLDLRGHVFNNGKVAGNVGIGERTIISSINHIFGAYCYYDVRQENHHLNVVNQVGPGLELLGKRMEYRINGYFPVGRTKSHKWNYLFDRFDGNTILLKYKRKFAMTGGDAEIGAHLTQSTKYDLYFGAGPYYFSATHASSWGGKARLIGRYKEYISLEASYSYDHLFKNVIQGSIAFNVPFGRKLKRKDSNCPQQNDLMLSRAALSPYRFEIPVVKRQRFRTKAINSATGNPWQVWFVNNTSSSAGTFQSPFPTLVQAQNASSPNDIIYVFPGDGTTTGMNKGLTLQDNQLLLGSGISHKISTTNGKVTIPAFSSTSPSLTNTTDVITLANGNVISGMNILTPAGATGIITLNGATTGTTNGAIIDRNILSGSQAFFGMYIQGAGNFSITNNQVIAPTSFAAGNIGIWFVPLGQELANATLSNNIISGFNVAMQSGLNTVYSPPSTNLMISGNTISNFGLVATQIFSQSNTTARIAGNTINNTSSTPAASIAVTLTVGPSSGTYSIDNNTVNITTTAPAVGIGGTISVGTVQMNIANNTILTGTGAGSAGLLLSASGSGALCSSITNNQISLQAPTGTNGMSITTTGSGVINIDAFSQDQAPAIAISGNVNFVAPGTCSQ